MLTYTKLHNKENTDRNVCQRVQRVQGKKADHDHILPG